MYQFGVMLKGWNKMKGLKHDFNYGSYEDLCVKNAKAFGINKAATYNGEAVNADGGFTVPVEFAAIVVEFAIATSPILSQVWRVPMSSNEIRFPKLSQGENGNYFGGVYMTCDGLPAVSEGTIGTGTKTKWEQNIFRAKKIAGHTAITEELQQDSIINILNYTAALYIRAFQYKLEAMIISGNGTNEFLGIITDPIVRANAVKRKAAGKVSGDDFISLEGAVDEAFGDDKLSWLTRRATVAKVRVERVNPDGTGAYLVRESWAERNDTPILTKSILGHPYHVTRNVPVLGTIGDVVIGDMSMYMLATRMDMRIDISDAPYWLENETALRMIARMDGMPGTPYAFKILAAAKAS
jgi:HK97 family phage major capsid protein